jgi:hypothetical protein
LVYLEAVERVSGFRVVLVGGCMVAGVGLLAGPGWALLTAAAALWAVPTPALVVTWVRQAGARARGMIGSGRRWMATHSRRAAALVSAPVAVVLIPVGVGITFGVGFALVSAGLIFGAGALFAGWNA